MLRVCLLVLVVLGGCSAPAAGRDEGDDLFFVIAFGVLPALGLLAAIGGMVADAAWCRSKRRGR